MTYIHTTDNGGRAISQSNPLPTQLTGSNVELETRLQLGALVKVPFKPQQYGSVLGGTATISLSSYGVSANADSSFSCLFVSVPAGLDNGATIRVPFWGRAFGVRVQNTPTVPPFDVLIDGVSYKADPALKISQGYGIDGECLCLIEDGLSDGLHYAELNFTSQTSGTRSWNVFGILVDSRAGYDAPKRVLSQTDPIALPTLDTQIYAPAIRFLRGIRKIIYVNTTAAPIQVTIKSGATVLWTSNIPANGTDAFDFGDVTSYSTALTHAGAVVGINATVIGGVV